MKDTGNGEVDRELITYSILQELGNQKMDCAIEFKEKSSVKIIMNDESVIRIEPTNAR